MAKKGRFKSVDPRVDFPKLEEEILAFWQKEKIFEKSLEARKDAKKFTFYDGPPFATGLPHYGHILAMTIKDAICRLKTMQGYFVPRRLGWDTHGLPVEYELEKELGISGKKQIEERGVSQFNEACRNIVFRYTKEWEKTIDRMGRWADKENTYATLETDYMESIWWVFKTLWEKGLIYRGFRSMPYCPRCGTPLSNFETNLGYKDDVSDPSVYVKFRAKDAKNTYFLVWTTTPWTLPGNAALAVNPKVVYAKVKVGDQYLILAHDRLSVLDACELVKEIPAAELADQKYEPLFESFPDYLINKEDADKKPYRIVFADFVSIKDGTGIVHVAPAFGENDMELGKKENLPQIQPVDKDGEMLIAPYKGIFVKKADPMIIENLDERGLLYKAETIKHTYPFCWRCETPLIYYAIGNWFVKVADYRTALVKNNRQIHWTPGHIKEGRFGKWLAAARDWSISRNRFWGTPLPVWQCADCQEFTVIGSVRELCDKAVNFDELIGDSKPLFEKGKQKSSSYPVDLHRPYIDRVKVRCQCGGEARRIEEVLDCWFESGSMPYAQDHYPFENKKSWEASFPADFVAEGLDQTRGWFYTLHVLSTLLFDKPSFKNIIVNGIVVDKNGKKLSKRLRNYPEPHEVFDKYGADAMRLYLLGSPAAQAEDVRFSAGEIYGTVRKFFLILWNIYVFFTTYANLDNWQADRKTDLKTSNVLDKWIVSRLNSTILQIEEAAWEYHLPKMIRPIQLLIEDISSWYVRRSRDRVGPLASDSSDKSACYQTFYYVLCEVCKLLAPFSPFIADEIYRNLSGKVSVHLEDYPKPNKKFIDSKLEAQMKVVFEIVEAAHALRKKHGIKVRQPLSRLIYNQLKLAPAIEKLIIDEINVKKIIFQKGGEFSLDTKIGPELAAEGEAREIVRAIQQARKEAGCKLDEKVDVVLSDWPEGFEEYIKRETLTKSITKGAKLAILRN